MWATCPKTWNGGKKQAFFAAQIGGGQKWAPYLFRLKTIFYKNAKKQNLLPFLNVSGSAFIPLYYKKKQ